MPIVFIEQSRQRSPSMSVGSEVAMLSPSKCPFSTAVRVSLHLNACMEPIRQSFEELNRIVVESARCHHYPHPKKDRRSTIPVRGFPLGVRFIPMDEVKDILIDLLSGAEVHDAEWAYSFSTLIAEGCSSNNIVDVAAMTACVWPLTRLDARMIMRLIFDHFNTTGSGFISAADLDEILHIQFEGAAALLLDIAENPSRYGLSLQPMREKDVEDARCAFTSIFDCEKIPEIVARCVQNATNRHRQTDDADYNPYKQRVTSSARTSREPSYSSSEATPCSAPSYGKSDTFGHDVPEDDPIIRLEDITDCYMLTRRLSLVSHNAWTLS